MNWDRMKDEGKGTSSFIRLKDGESIEGVFRGEPYVFYKVYQDKVEYDAWAEGRNFRFRINMVVKDGAEYKAKIFEGGKRLANELWTCQEEYGLDCVYKIIRTGSGKENTQYKVLFKSKLTEEVLDKIKNVPLETLRFGGFAKAQTEKESVDPRHEDLSF